MGGQSEKKESITQIRNKLQAADEDLLPVVILQYKDDEREGVRKLVISANKR